ncbi:hypothetical protein ACH5RR_007978 [Cinchona calisaya]|uniref:Uncharacterized protein n=1 Tax=Cinchona calisaya TaxID=153742 RepID=A0ABD3ACN0_9GENT
MMKNEVEGRGVLCLGNESEEPFWYLFFANTATDTERQQQPREGREERGTNEREMISCDHANFYFSSFYSFLARRDFFTIGNHLTKAFDTDYVQEQDMEIEELEAILMDDFKALTAPNEKKLTGRQWFGNRRAAVKTVASVDEGSNEDVEDIDFDDDDFEGEPCLNRISFFFCFRLFQLGLHCSLVPGK